VSPIDVFFEVHGPPPTLIIFGAGHVSMPLVSLAHDLGLKTIVVDGRPRFATRERFPEVDELLIGIPSEIAQTLTYNSSTFVALTAHDYKYDLPILKVVLPAGAAYVGLLGSKRRGKSIKDFLKEGGMDQSLLDRLHVPTGLVVGDFTHQQVGLRWNTVAGAAGYNVYRSTAAGGPYGEAQRVSAQPVARTVFVDYKVDPTTKYFYVVRAVSSANNESADSGEVAIVTAKTPPACNPFFSLQKNSAVTKNNKPTTETCP
jgi:hypothetical protein